MSPLELVAIALGLTSVYLTVRRSMWLWPTGLAQVVLYAWIFWSAGLYSNTALQVVFALLQAYGWWHWARGGAAGAEPPVTRLSLAALAASGGLALLLAAPLGYAMGTWAGAARPYWDASATTLSLAAQWLLARKVRETWLLWILVDVLSVGLFASQGLHGTAALYAVFLGLAVQGWREWGRSS